MLVLLNNWFCLIGNSELLDWILQSSHPLLRTVDNTPIRITNRYQLCFVFPHRAPNIANVVTNIALSLVLWLFTILEYTKQTQDKHNIHTVEVIQEHVMTTSSIQTQIQVN